MFHRERKECGPENGKIKGEKRGKSTGLQSGKKKGARTAVTNRGKTARETEANRKDGTQTAKEKL